MCLLCQLIKINAPMSEELFVEMCLRCFMLSREGMVVEALGRGGSPIEGHGRKHVISPLLLRLLIRASLLASSQEASR